MSASIETTPAGQMISTFDATAALAQMRTDWSELGDAAPRHVTPLEADLDPGLTGHTVYNFEVEGTHTYIADGVRVHNTSSLTFLKDGETNIRPLEGYTDFDAGYRAELLEGRGTVETVTTASGETPDGEYKEVTKSFTIYKEGAPTTGDDNLEITQVDVYETIPGTGELERTGSKITHIETPEGALTGDAFNAVTPFLSAAIAGKDANFFEKVATDTVVGTLLKGFGNGVGDFAGYLRNVEEITAYDGTDDPIGDIFAEEIAELPTELFANGLKNSANLASQLVMAEIYEAISLDGVEGAVFEALGNDFASGLLELGLGHIPINGIPFSPSF